MSRKGKTKEKVLTRPTGKTPVGFLFPKWSFLYVTTLCKWGTTVPGYLCETKSGIRTGMEEKDMPNEKNWDDYADMLKEQHDMEREYESMCKDAGTCIEQLPNGIIIDKSGSLR